MRVIGLVTVMAGCQGDPGDKGDPPTTTEDRDRDGFGADVDCDDADETIWPGAPDTPYDGVDSDCGEDDDYDQDGDGHPSDDHGGDDCVDSNAAIAPSLPEVPYDLLDNDCDPLTPDDDVDGDGFVVRDDCDDEDPLTFPGGLERLGDAVDGDCDGGADTAPFGHGELRWSIPTRPRLVHTAEGFVLTVAADSVSGGLFYPYENPHVAVALTFDSLAVGAAVERVPPLVWHGELDDDVLYDVDLEVTATGIVAGTTWFSGVSRFGNLLLQPAHWQPAVGWLLDPPSYFDQALIDAERVDVALDDGGVPWLCASDDDTVGYVRLGGVLGDGGVAAADGSRDCFLEPDAGDPMPFTSCDLDGDCTTWRTDPDGADPVPVVAPSQPWSGETWEGVRERAGVLTARPQGGGVLLLVEGDRIDLLDGLPVLDAEGVREADGTVWLAAVTDRGSGWEIVLTWGDPLGGPLTEAWLPLADVGRTFVPTGATVEVTADRIAVAVTGDDDSGGADTVAWAFYGR